MTLLRFNPAGALDCANGLSAERLDSLGTRLAAARDQLSESDGDAFHNTLRYPEKLLTDYEAKRENSELGRVFRVANRLHDHLDAVAVVGEQATLLAPSALMQACCEPFHNELSRAARGSKPRLYFSAASLDNDAVEGLLRRLATGGDSTHAAEQRYGLVAIDSPDNHALASQATAVSMGLIGEQLTAAHGDAAAKWIPKLMIPVSPAKGPVRAMADHYHCARDFQFDRERGGPLGLYSAAHLLPAALLGLDCIQLLVGAAAMNEHFQKSSFADNAVLQFAAVHWASVLAEAHYCNGLRVWNPALGGMASWCGRVLPMQPVGLESPPGRGVIHHLCVDAPRTDPLPAPNFLSGRPLTGTTSATSPLDEAGEAPTLPDLMKDAIAAKELEESGAGQASTRLTLPRIDTHSLGQLYQFIWLARECLTAVHPRDGDHKLPTT
ncbi:Glucose-6-phosphate isomerase B [Allorhodopirellula solitaria]|uniref:Glucose-6-phosphate isomerase B n=2 Tax=Allorhodopirellula solitaria TaxID=2527987 RepID=A0A5C5YDD9_9BACT|nr:Glucose-6-phosphate isomerase B [Allorhodopirellula solitaria]